MFKFFFEKHLHESIAAAALVAGGAVLNFAWVINLLVHRSEEIRAAFTISKTVGPMGGMLLADLVLFLLVFGGFTFYWRDKDCSHKRNAIFWFLIISLILFFLMTLPIVYEFGVGIE